jgi:hypothetical protein
MAGGLLHRTRNCRQPVAGEKPVTVELIQQIRSCSPEKHLHRLLLAAQNGPSSEQFAAQSRPSVRWPECFEMNDRNASRAESAALSNAGVNW